MIYDDGNAEEIAFPQSEGTTPTERLLATLGNRCFLSLWSHPNLFRDQDGGKEICDLAVLFGRDLIIFSDKSCAFDLTTDLPVAWSRWCRKAILEGAKQVAGAERWLLNFPDRVFLNRDCSLKFPFEIPSPNLARVHRIVVARGADEVSRSHYGDPRGTFIIKPGLQSSQHTEPFVVGSVAQKGGFIHVLNETALDLLLTELDTATDLCAYLRAKEDFISSGNLFEAGGEEDLLAAYLFGNHSFPTFDGEDRIVISAGTWDEFEKTGARAAKADADRISYAWDMLIEQFAGNFRGGTLENLLGAPATPPDFEKGLRILAAERRLARRMLGEAFVDILKNTRPDQTRFRMLLSADQPEAAYGFLIASQRNEPDYRTYRERRVAMLTAYCHVMKLAAKDARYMVGVAREPVIEGQGASEDLCCIDTEPWTPEREAEAKMLQRTTGMLAAPQQTAHRQWEFPLEGSR